MRHPSLPRKGAGGETELGPIKTEQEYERAMAEVTALVEADPAAGTPEASRLEWLAARVEWYEKIHFPIREPDWSGLAEAARFANKHRAAVVRARLRCMSLEQAVKWCRGRIEFLEGGQWSTAIGDVVQIHPAQRALGGALAFVTEVHRWGIVAEVTIPGRGIAPVRLGETEFIRIGPAPWQRVDP